MRTESTSEARYEHLRTALLHLADNWDRAVAGVEPGVLVLTHRMHAKTLRFLLEELDSLASDASNERVEDAVHDAEYRALQGAGQESE